MKIKRILLSMLLLGALSAFAMTDQEVIAYVKAGIAAGKSQQQIGKELLAKGVTPEQAERIKAAYDAQESTENSVTTQTVAAGNAERRHDVAKDMTSASMDDVTRELDKGRNGRVSARRIYGHDVFNSQALTFEPSNNLATPKDYRLGPGDEVIIDIWGTSEDHVRGTISPEGSIIIQQLGPLYLNGLTIADATQHIKNAFAKKYAGMDDSETDIQVTLGQVRSIQVDLMGEVAVPGTYRMSPFSSVFHALYRAGGINDIGTMRNIQVLRNGKKIAGIDVYEYLFNGKTNSNIRLQEGDVIIVPPYETLVDISGNVKRPMYYEIKPNESIKTLIDYAGGFTGDAYSENVRLARQSGSENELYNIDRADFENYQLRNGDIVTVGSILDRYANRVELKGAVYRPGMFAIGGDLNTVSQLIDKADGLMDDAYLDRALLYREGPNLELQVLALDLGAILAGQAADIELKRNDVLTISSIHELQERGSFTINGMVARPGVYPYAEHFTLEDLIFRAGGLLEGASTARVDIARRIVDPTSTEQTQQLSRIYSVSIENGLAVGRAKGFILEPYDHVQVRRSPGYEAQETVSIEGEILFGGTYVLERRNERITDIIRRAGGLLDNAYIKGAYLTRRMSDDEVAARKAAVNLVLSNQEGEGKDSLSMNKIDVAPYYNVGINLQKALDNPGSHYDFVLQPGDRLFIPQQQSTVKIMGDVMYPNTVVYEPGQKVKYYIDQAGGYGQTAKKNKAFIVYMNGSVARAKGSTPIEPGCQIIVPSKSEGKGVDWAKIVSLTTGIASLGTMSAAIASIVK